MGETKYPLGYGEKVVRFEDGGFRYGCLCTFPFNYSNHKLDIGTVESLALLGAALCLSINGGLQEVGYVDEDEYVIPDCIPQWIRDEIRRNLGDYPEKFDEDKYDIDPIFVSDEDHKRMLINRFKDIEKWAEQSIKEIRNGEY